MRQRQMAELREQSSRTATLIDGERMLAKLSAEQRVAWALDRLPGVHIVSSSFGAQSAVMLHLVSTQKTNVPVVVIDTGYLFAETYRFIDELSARLQLNLAVFRPELSSAWQEARYGRRWEHGIAGIDAYNQGNKVEPMARALQMLNVGTWFAGLRRSQSKSRTNTRFLEASGERWKVHPIADWSDRRMFEYLQAHDLPYHPLWQKGYVSIGDVHTTRPLAEASSVDGTRFYGLKRECGLHEMDYSKTG